MISLTNKKIFNYYSLIKFSKQSINLKNKIKIIFFVDRSLNKIIVKEILKDLFKINKKIKVNSLLIKKTTGKNKKIYKKLIITV